MPRIVREATVAWEGNLARGAGSLTAATSGAFTGLPYSLATRVGEAEGKTSPEELLAAAHGGCFTMSLAGELTRAGTPPGRLDVRCTITMDEVEGEGHRIVHSGLDVRAAVAGVDAAAFATAVEAADRGCPFSALLRAAGVAIDTTTSLEGGD
jgi:osmotically inducible protein OsmC